MSRTNFDNIIRTALWNSYNNKCFYCSQSLLWDDLQIDHLVPESIVTDPNRFSKLKSDYELNNDFRINDLYNLVPTHSRCNNRKTDILFSKKTTLFYLEITQQKIEKIEAEILKIKTRKNKGQIISKLQSALCSNLIDIKELKELIKKAEESNWNNKKIKLPIGVSFIDEVFDNFYLNMDTTKLYDKKLLVGGFQNYLILIDDKGNKIKISTLREWQKATKNGYFPLTTYALKMSSSFTFLEELLQYLKIAKMPSVSFLSEPWIELDNLDLLSPSLLTDFEGVLEDNTAKNMSIGDLVREGIVIQNESSNFKVSLEINGIETSFIEQFRADFNDDGIEDIFVRGWTRATEGTLGFGFTNILTRLSPNHLITAIN